MKRAREASSRPDDTAPIGQRRAKSMDEAAYPPSPSLKDDSA
jgi:hypothetical protein